MFFSISEASREDIHAVVAGNRQDDYGKQAPCWWQS